MKSIWKVYIHISVLDSELENCDLQKRTPSETSPRTKHLALFSVNSPSGDEKSSQIG